MHDGAINPALPRSTHSRGTFAYAVCNPARVSEDDSQRDALAALDAATEQMATSAREALREHLLRVAQERVETELQYLRDSGVWQPRADGRFVLSVEWEPTA